MMTFVCNICGKKKREHKSGGVGYGVLDGQKVCYACCADLDLTYMRETGKITLYLTKKDERWFVTNWPASLSFPVCQYKEGKHNMAGTRTDVWFRCEGSLWHGVQYGEQTELCHCKRTKA